ncbi:BMC domain-containing protein [Olsenella umbonata]|uniref:BMC domain-containing protein n=1 Tax=Parafannyhessea umbonata TaxID=604330 RepID=A0A1H1KSL2_9ACTN|nr:BMC domain-containing protein [Parafannyhessea umbonata]NMF25737.1 BMC domain-containing protein [Parafannyhessea umbonata]SDR65097.1 ethanolamine utilization protein EutS [Parafannyhessea umbonata]
MARQRVTRQQFFDEVFHGSVPRDENGEIRITRVRVPGREVDLAHVMGTSARRTCETLGLDIGTHEGEDHTGEALGFMRFTPWEAVVVAADIAVKHGSVELGFMDRFNGSLILCGQIAEIESAEQEILDYFDHELDFHVCKMTRR